MLIEDSQGADVEKSETPSNAGDSQKSPLIVDSGDIAAALSQHTSAGGGFIGNAESGGDTLDLGATPSQVVGFTTQNEYVIAIHQDGTTSPIPFDVAMQRVISLRESLRCDDGSTPWEVLERRAWLIIETTKAVQEVSNRLGLDVNKKGVELFLKAVESEVKMARKRRLRPD